MSYGNMPNDGGFLLLSEEEVATLRSASPRVRFWIRPFVGPDEMIKGNKRWCLWLNDADPAEVRRIPELVRRVQEVRRVREESSREETNRLARTPMLFGEVRQPTRQYLGVPKTSGERRRYIPMAFFEPKVIASSDLLTVEGADLFTFGVLSSAMHMSWVRTVAGRLKSDYRYSARLVYNNFPWPTISDVKRRAAVEKAAESVLTSREPFVEPNGANTLSDIYDPNTMPASLAAAHGTLDRAVERCYRGEQFKTEKERVEHLFGLYEQLTSSPLTPTKRRARAT